MTIQIDLHNPLQAMKYGDRLAVLTELAAMASLDNGALLGEAVNGIELDEAHSLLFCSLLLLADYVE